MKRWLSLFAAVPCCCLAQVDPWNFPGQFPQFRDMSGLPGGGFGLTIKGDPSIRGAMSLSTPIGFSLGSGRWNLGISSRSVNSRPAFFSTSPRGSTGSDGTLQLMHGVNTPVGTLTGSFMVLSSARDSVFNLQLQLPSRSDKVGYSVGVQNAFNRPHAASDLVPGEDNLSRSLFVVGTYEFLPGSFGSVGFGTVRFKGLFGNACYLLQPRLKFTAEYDTFGFNVGVAHTLGRLGSTGGRLDNGDFTIWAGMVQMKRATVTLNFTF